MKFFNVHTHNLPHEDEVTIRVCGLHPWNVKEDWQKILGLFLGPLNFPGYSPPESLEAIGECGLDKLCQTPYDLQLAAFKAQIIESERRRLPIILHCVRAQDDAIKLKNGTHQAWVWHGFRGKPEQMQQLLDHGFYISFGLKYNEQSLASCPSERLFLETDKEDVHIRKLYDEASQLRNTTIEALQEQVWTNADTLFANLRR